MDEASNSLEDISIPHQQIPTGYHKLTLDLPFVNKVVDPTLCLESEEHVVRPTLPLESEVEVVESMPSPPYPTKPLESVNTEVVTLT